VRRNVEDRMRRIVLALVLIPLLAACTRGGSTAEAEPRRVATTPVQKPSFQVADPSVTEPSPGAIEGAELGADGRTLTLRYWDGVEACGRLHSVTVAERTGRLVVTRYSGSVPMRPGETQRACVRLR
jgi:hypothetical protein